MVVMVEAGHYPAPKKITPENLKKQEKKETDSDAAKEIGFEVLTSDLSHNYKIMAEILQNGIESFSSQTNKGLETIINRLDIALNGNVSNVMERRVTRDADVARIAPVQKPKPSFLDSIKNRGKAIEVSRPAPSKRR